MPIQIATGPLVCQNIWVAPLLTDPQALLLFQPARDLFRAPSLSQQALHPRPDFSSQPQDAFLSAIHCQFMRWLWTLTALASIAFQCAAHAGLVNANHTDDLHECMFGFPQRINLVSLGLGQLVLGSHQRSRAVPRAPLTWSSETHYASRTPAYLSATCKVALTS